MLGNKNHYPTMDEMQDVLNVVSVPAAAQLWHISRQTIYYQIDRGRLAAKQDMAGRWHVSVQSLVNLWGAPLQSETYDLAGKTVNVRR